ncbi:MAG TPA: hydrogenase subunit MbhD domain-containing protein [Bacteroidota bacterium]|nr:hydrogenase subunit MbhD domain-containing protein [Bacteroidota bacterium]
MHWELELILLILLVATAVLALEVRDLLTAVVTLGVFSFLSALLFVVMGAVDVGFTEAVVGAGVTTVLFVVALYHTTRETDD